MQRWNIQITKRGIQIALGILWFLDGVLQLQPQMFTTRFATDVIAPAAEGQPLFVSAAMHLFIHIFLLQPVFFNACIAVIQLGLGALLLFKRTAKLGLVCSVVWGLFVWYIGEGLGGLASGQGLLLMGAPGAAIIYALLALGSIPNERKQQGSKEKEPPAYWLVLVWAISWVMGAVYQLLPGQNTVSAISSIISDNASAAPGWLASIDTYVVNILNSVGGVGRTTMTGMDMTADSHMTMSQSSGLWLILLFAGVQLLIGVMVLLPGSFRRVALVAGIIFSLVFWVVGQSLGGYFTGLATDPNTAPLFVLLGVALFSNVRFDVIQLRKDLVQSSTRLGNLWCIPRRKRVQ